VTDGSFFRYIRVGADRNSCSARYQIILFYLVTSQSKYCDYQQIQNNGSTNVF